MSRFRSCSVALFLLALAASAGAQPVQWTSGPGANGHWYQAVHTPGGISWTDAEAAAASILPGGHLATITSSAENAFVFGLIDDPSFWYADTYGTKLGPWLGGTDAAVEGQWQWVTGEAWGYTHWAQGEPNQFQGNNEDYLQFSDYWADPTPRDSTWNDLAVASGEGVRGYVVESSAPPPVPALSGAGLVAMSVLVPGLGALLLRRRA